MPTDTTKITATQILLCILFPAIFPALILLLGGDVCWIEAWIFAIWYLLMCWSIPLYLYYKDPDLLSERFIKPGEGGQKDWDKYFLSITAIAFIAWVIIIPLDAKRYGWSTHFPLWLQVLGGIGLIKSYFFFFRSFSDNTFLSPLVRIQTERKQTVVSTGVYGFVRHPMYLGAIAMFISAPVLMSSKFGIIIGVILCFLIAVRIIGEEKLLSEELEGYTAYKLKVKYRLIPFVW
jgi:protein-S-isoprenylcysteine O-methyltransferase Ste14